MDQPSPSSATAPQATDGLPAIPWDEGVFLPDAAFRHLTAALRNGGSAGRAALREAGRGVGGALFRAVEDAGDLPPEAFWERVGELSAPAGLGRPDYAVLSPGVASVTLDRGAELGRDDGGGCHFAVGWIAGLLTRGVGCAA